MGMVIVGGRVSRYGGKKGGQELVVLSNQLAK